MKKSGFTLVELLGVLVLLSLLALLSFVVIDKVLKDSKQEMYEKQIKTIEMAAKNWGADHLATLEVGTITLGTLKSEGYVPKDISDPKTGKCFSDENIIEITKQEERYIYTVLDKDNMKEEDCL